MITTAVVILAYNSEKYLRQFLPTLIANTVDAEVWVVDNNSKDGTKDLLLTTYKETVKSLFFDQNYGFSGGYNKALAAIEATNFVLLNSDVEVSKNWLKPLVEGLAGEKIGAIQPKLLSFHSKDMFEYAGGSGGFLDLFGYPFCRGRVFEECEKDVGQYNDSIEIFWATGACLAIKKENFVKAGGFDDRFFAHMEEIDLCWRLKLSGFKNLVIPSSTVYHVGGGTLHKSNPRKTFLNFRNGLLLLMKNLNCLELFPVIFIRLILDGVAAIKMLLGGDYQDFWAIIKAHFAFYTMIPYAIKKRRDINRKNVVERFSKSIVWQYFVLKKKKYTDIINA